MIDALIDLVLTPPAGAPPEVVESSTEMEILVFTSR